MTKKNMLIDAAHPEEVRVAVIDRWQNRRLRLRIGGAKAA